MLKSEYGRDWKGLIEGRSMTSVENMFQASWLMSAQEARLYLVSAKNSKEVSVAGMQRNREVGVR